MFGVSVCTLIVVLFVFVFIAAWFVMVWCDLCFLGFTLIGWVLYVLLVV